MFNESKNMYQSIKPEKYQPKEGEKKNSTPKIYWPTQVLAPKGQYNIYFKGLILSKVLHTVLGICYFRFGAFIKE